MPRKNADPACQVKTRHGALISSFVGAWRRIVDDASGTSFPLPELADDGENYDLSVWIHFALDTYQRDEHDQWPPVVTGDDVRSAGRKDGVWPWRRHGHQRCAKGR